MRRPDVPSHDGDREKVGNRHRPNTQRAEAPLRVRRQVRDRERLAQNEKQQREQHERRPSLDALRHPDKEQSHQDERDEVKHAVRDDDGRAHVDGAAAK